MRVGLAGILLICGLAAWAGEDRVDIRLRDGRSTDPRRACHDITDLRLRIEKGECVVDVTMAKPFRESMFLDAHIEFDTDNDAKTGYFGFDFGVHAFAGSRYRRNSATDAGADPLERRGTVIKFCDKARTGRSSFTHSTRPKLAPPRIEKSTMQFRFPLDLLRQHGLRYNKQVRWRFYTESSISEHPVATEYVCSDEGMTVAVDGNARDWPPIGVQVADRRGELHPDATEIDITRLQVEHDKDSIYALVRLARAGFGSSPVTGDVVDRDTLVVCLEPVGARAYMRFVEAKAYTYQSEGAGVAHRHCAGSRLVEFSFPRKPEQTKFRILAYADAVRVDSVPDTGANHLAIPTKAWDDE